MPQLRRDVANSLKGLKIDTCPFANLPEKKRTQWALIKEENEKLYLTQTGAGCTNRIHRVDAGWALEAFKVRRVEGR